jgi:hypothetical protein
MALPPRLDAHHIQDLFDVARKPEDVMMPCERCGTMPARQTNPVGITMCLCAARHHDEYASQWEIWNN